MVLILNFSTSMGSSLSVVNVSDPGNLEVVQTETFAMSDPGPDPIRQDSPHPHEVLLDPAHQYILIPDLGADLVRVFGYDSASLEFTAKEPLVATPGSGPRHAAFIVTEESVFMYLVGELSNSITTYEVTYDNEASGLEFREVAVIGSFGNASHVPQGVTSAEIQVSVSTPSPDGPGSEKRAGGVDMSICVRGYINAYPIAAGSKFCAIVDTVRFVLHNPRSRWPRCQRYLRFHSELRSQPQDGCPFFVTAGPRRGSGSAPVFHKQGRKPPGRRPAR